MSEHQALDEHIIADLRAQVTALKQERDGLMRRIEEEEPIFHDMLKQLAASEARVKELEEAIEYRRFT